MFTVSPDKSDDSQTGGREEKTLPFPPRINSVFLLYLLLNKCLFSFSAALSYEITMKLLN